MIIKKLELTNFRSHAHSVISFPLGKTLLEGDIGSGKSSVLMAIEFALFGLGSDSGSSVLRLGRDEGEVRMAFDVDGSEYEVTRRLKRKSGRVQQSDGYLRTPGEPLNLSPSELKEKILEVLEFNEAPDPKAQSWIYRYAIYTPQEEMKEILTLLPEQRLQILRRAFRVEDYKTAATNAQEAAKEIRVESSTLRGIAMGIEELRKQVDELRYEEDRHKTEIARLEGTATKQEGEVGRLRSEKEELQRREANLQTARVEKDYHERMRSESAKDSLELERDLKDLHTKLSRAEGSLRQAPGGRPRSPRPVAVLRRREGALEAKARKLTGLKSAVESKLADYESIMKNGVCPVCDRPADAHDFEGKRSSKERERKHVSEELAAVDRELVDLQRTIDTMENYLRTKKDRALLNAESSRLKKEIAKKETAKRRLEKRISFAEKTLARLSKQLEELVDLAQKVKANGRLLAQAEETLEKVKEDLVKGKERFESVRKQQTKIVAEITSKEAAARKSKKLREREVWLADYFVPTVSAIEKSVLATINQEFDSLFKRWFGMLVSDPDKEVSVDEDFTPFVSQGGYEQDVKYLSGGERTSVALAYRLALNILAQRVSAGMKSNLLILDEPTDGFSKEQLGNIREVLDEVGCPQVIIVSHDKELESFADQIFRVEKAGSESTIRVPQA